jgi:hypothetical protein
MELQTTLFDRALHLVMFAVGAAAVGLAALAVIETLSDGARRTIRPRFIVIAVVVFGLLFITERTYHALS